MSAARKSLNSTFRNSMLAKIHIAKKQLGLSDDDYRAILDVNFGVSSSKDLNMRQLNDFLSHLSRVGFKPTSKAPRKPKRDTHGTPRQTAMTREAMLSKAEALLAEIANYTGETMPWSYAAAILKRQYKIDRLEWAKPVHLRGLIAALDNRLKTLDRKQKERLLEQLSEEPA